MTRSERLRKAAIEEVKAYYETREDLEHDIKAAAGQRELSMMGARHLVTGGCFLIYYSDVRQWLHANGSDRRIKDCDRNWNIYVETMAKAAYGLAKKLIKWEA